MQLTIFGGTGGTGRHLVDDALAAGHDVVAVVRDPGKVTVAHERLSLVRGDVLDPTSVKAAVSGADAVLSALGLRSRKAAPVCGPATANMLAGMSTAGVRRFVAVSAAPVGADDPGDRQLYRVTVKRLLRAVFRDAYADMARMEAHAAASDAEWTIFRPPRLTDKPRTDRYRTTPGHNVPGGYFISRADVAAEMLRSLDDPSSFGKVVGIAH